MNEKEFKRYKKESLKTLKNYRKDIEQHPDEIQLKLEAFWDNFQDVSDEWRKGEGYPSLPDGSLAFFYRVGKELFAILSHLEETGKWRVPCAIRHFDDLLFFSR